MTIARELADFAHAVSEIMGRNRLINPDGGIYQRPVAATADDAYFADRWYALTQSGSITPSVLNDPEDGYPKGVRLTQSQASAQRFGYAQIIEGAFCKDLRGRSGVFVPRLRVSNSQAIRYAILGWTGTEDSVTSDVVNDWTSGTYTAGNFFLGSNLSVIAVGSQTPSANTWISLDPITAALGSSFNNIIVMVWMEGTAAQNVTLDFDFNQFEAGDVPTEFERRTPMHERAQCERYFEKSFKLETAPSEGSGGQHIIAAAFSTAQVRAWVPFRTSKRADPTVTLYRPSDIASPDGEWAFHAGGSWTAPSGGATTAVRLEENGFNVNINESAAFTQGDAHMISGNWTAEAEL